MRLEDLAISKEQAQEIARTIYADIGDYIKKHSEEFELFLAQKNNKTKEDLK